MTSKCKGCYWAEQNKRRWPCHICDDGSYYTVNGVDYPKGA